MNDSSAMTNPVTNTIRTTILVVEDEVMVRAFLTDELRAHGYVVIEAVNAVEALAVLRSHLRVELVVTDLNMPGELDGAGLVPVIRTEFPFVKVVMVSGQFPDQKVRDSLDGYFSKPVVPSELSAHLKALVPPVRDLGPP
jgi:CheY-like chemotaxis protein